MQVYVTCDTCGGTGQVWNNFIALYVPCKECKGSGTVIVIIPDKE